MSDARRLLKIAADADDCALLGVSLGATRALIIAATEARLRAIAAHVDEPAQVVAMAMREVRNAAQRVAAASGSGPTDRPDAAPSHAPSHPPHLRVRGMAAMVYMRRDPRRARMLLAQTAVNRSAVCVGSNRPIDVVQRVTNEPVTGDATHPVPWLLATAVVLSVIGLIGEIVMMRSQTPAASAVDASATAVQSPLVPRDGTPQQASADAPVVGESPTTLQDWSARNPRPDTQPTDPSTQPRGSTPQSQSLPEESTVDRPELTEFTRALRERWRRAVDAASAIPNTESGVPARAMTIGGERVVAIDALDEPLRQTILLERMMVLDLVARQLEVGEDREASLLLETVSTDVAVSMPARSSPLLPVTMEHDGALRKSLSLFAGTNQARLAILREYRTRPIAPGPLDARRLVEEVLKGPTSASRTIAQGILVARGMDAMSVLEAIDERFDEFAANPALSGMIRALSGVDPSGLEGHCGSHAALVGKMIELRGSRASQLDRATQDVVITLGKIARRLSITTSSQDPAELLWCINPHNSAARVRDDRWELGGALHALVLNGSALLRAQSSALTERRAVDRQSIAGVLGDAAAARAHASTALGQAIANARGMLALDAISLGLPPWRAAEPFILDAPTSREWDVPTSNELSQRWGARLAALDPEVAEDYLRLAEEVADDSGQPESRALARQLYALAGVLDSQKVGTSAALGLAALEDSLDSSGGTLARWWFAIAQRFSDTQLEVKGDSHASVRRSGSQVRLAIVDALTEYRRGNGRRSNDRLKDAQVRAVFETLIAEVPGGAAEFDRIALESVNGVAPTLSDETIESLLRLERALLRSKDDLWSDAFALGEGRPIGDAPLGSPSELFGADVARSLWRNGFWVDRSATSSALPPAPTR
ncbi:MAG: hypothetical protein EXS15_03920 [Phycisphaerales bacterium]|nr:hypothetical protein [Phycisphaerales bacterium]